MDAWVCLAFIPVTPTVFNLCRHPEDDLLWNEENKFSIIMHSAETHGFSIQMVSLLE